MTGPPVRWKPAAGAVAAALILSLAAAPPPPAAAGRAAVDPRLLSALDGGAGSVRVLVYLQSQEAWSDALQRAEEGRPLPGEVFHRSADRVIATAASASTSPGRDAPRPLWLAGAVAMQLDRSSLATVALLPDVEAIGPDPIVRFEPWAPGTPAEEPNPDGGSEAAWGVAAIGAPSVWRRLGIDGSGVVVGVVDSGVDYHHPGLESRYRGYRSGSPPVNDGNWWCKATDPLCGVDPIYPADGAGHGTHVSGTVLGDRGVGVAPGARWIAARVCQTNDHCSGSWVIEALQWLVDREPADRPDVVNTSLSLEDNLGLERAVRAVIDAGIVLVSSSGNSGPLLRAPAIYPGVVVVGATTDEGAIWPDSGYGTALDDAPKPDVVAPGVGITSTIPGGGYALSTGTSMAAPHVAGTVALLLEADPSLSPAGVADILRRSAAPVVGAKGVPDPVSGWGLVDAYSAVLAVRDTGRIHGRVTDAETGQPVPWAAVSVATADADPVDRVTVDDDGRWSLDLATGSYRVTVEAFTYADPDERDVTLPTDGDVNLDVSLVPRGDLGLYTGYASDAKTGARLAGEIRLAEAQPRFVIPIDPHNGFRSALPAGAHGVTVEAFGYRTVTDTLEIAAGQTLDRHYALDPAPRTLFVDGDAWAYSGAGDAFRASLRRLGLPYRDWRVTDKTAGVGAPGGPPSAAELQAYDLVVWSSSITGPTFVRGARALSAYLAAGGRLLLSGQDALCTDAGSAVPTDPCNRLARPDPYVREQLGVAVVEDNARATTLIGTPDGPWSGLTIELNGGDSMDNQSAPDVLEVTAPLLGTIVARYPDGRGAAVLADTCQPHRALSLGFGFEGIRGSDARDEVLARAVAALMAPGRIEGVVVLDDVGELTIPAGASAVFTGTVTNIGGGEDSFDLVLEDATWPAGLWSVDLERPFEAPLTLGACQSARFAIRLAVPEGTARGTRGTATVVARSTRSGAEARAAFGARTPAPVLVVDGDYGRDSEERYLAALRASGVAYDIWTIGRNGALGGPPSADDLDGYPAVVWFTADDWRPNGSVTVQSQRDLADYLDAGGRLLLSSEDYLSIRGGTPFAGERFFHREYLGVDAYETNEGLAHAGDLEGVAGSVLEGLGACRLKAKPEGEDYSDRLTPGGVAGRAAVRNLLGHPVGTQAATRAFRSLFLAFDAGTLDQRCADALLENSMDWFSPLSGSTLVLVPGEPATFESGDAVRLRLAIRNDSGRSLDGARVRWSVPLGANLDPTSIPGTWRWDPEARELAWSGDLASNTAVSPPAEITLLLDKDLPDGESMASVALLTGDGITVTREAAWRVNAPDLGGSSKSVPDADRVLEPGETAAFVVQLRNTGTRAAAEFTVTDTLPAGLELRGDSVLVDQGSLDVSAETGAIVWRGSLDPGRVASMSYGAIVRSRTGGWLENRAVADDGAGGLHDLSARVFARARLHLPWVAAEIETDP